MERPSSKTLQDSTIQVQVVVIRTQRLQQHPPLYQLQKHQGDHGMLWSGKWSTIWRWVEGTAKRRTHLEETKLWRVYFFGYPFVFVWSLLFFNVFQNIFCWRCSHPAVSITTIRLPWILQLERWSRGAIDSVLHQIDQLLVKTPKPPQPWDGWHNEKWTEEIPWDPANLWDPKGLVWSDFTGLFLLES